MASKQGFTDWSRQMSQESLFKKGTADWYRHAYATMEFDPGFENRVKYVGEKVWRNEQRYRYVATQFGIMPWYFVGGIHAMEAACDFDAVLHNGERILDTGLQTSLVPMGRGPFETWEQAAYDALHMKGFHHVKEWGIGNMLRLAELYNGAGYLRYHPDENSPYLWACTTLNDGYGKYVRDGKWDANAPTNGQVGFAAIVKHLEKSGIIHVNP